MKHNFRKLKQYFQCNEYGDVCMLGGREIELLYDDKTYTTYMYNHLPKEYEYLYDYYVGCIHPQYKIVNNKIVPYLLISLLKEVEELL